VGGGERSKFNNGRNSKIGNQVGDKKSFMGFSGAIYEKGRGTFTG